MSGQKPLSMVSDEELRLILEREIPLISDEELRVLAINLGKTLLDNWAKMKENTSIRSK